MAGATRAAVMTGNIKVTGSSATGYTISYILAQDVTSMTLKIANSSDTVIRTINVTDPGAMTAGAHVDALIWDGLTAGGTTAPSGDYYAIIETTGAPIAQLTELFAPVMQVDPNNSAKRDGRFYYGGGVDRNPASPSHNLLAYASYTNGNAGQQTGCYIVNPDCTTNNVIANSVQTIGDWIASSVLSDGRIFITGQTVGTAPIYNFDGTLYSTVTGTAPNVLWSRGNKAFGTSDAFTLYFGDVGSSGVSNVGGVDVTTVTGTTAAVPTIAVPRASLPTTLRDFDVKADGSVIYCSGRLSDGAGGNYVLRFVKQGDGSYLKDNGFTFTPPAGTTTSNLFVRLSHDENTLWIANNDGNTTADTNRFIVGVDPVTGASKGAAWTYQNITWAPETMAVAGGGNIYVTCYTSHLTGTTGDSFALLAPPDNGSSDTTRSRKFTVTQDTTIDITSGPTVSPITYHGGTVTWTTDLPSDSTVRWGYYSGVLDQVVTDTNLTKNHSVTIVDADQNVTIYYQVESNATGFTGATSAEKTFRTNKLDITNPLVAETTSTTATLTWKTSEPANTIVRYGLSSGNLDRTYTNTALVTDHSATLTNLTPLTQYFFLLESGWNGPTTPTQTAEMTFTTKAVITLVKEGLTAGTDSASLSFETNVATSAVIAWGTDPASLTNSLSVASGTTHTASFTGLAAGTTYYYAMTLTATDGGVVTMPVSAFTTEFGGGANASITHSTPDDIRAASVVNLEMGSAGNLVKLEKQCLPGAPVKGPDLPEERYYQGVVAYGGYLYVIGGRNNLASGNTRDTVFVAKINADGSLGAWTTTTPLPQPMLAMGDMCVGYNGHIYVVCGADAAFSSLSTVLYAPQNADGTLGAWNTTTPLPLPNGRDLGSVAVVDGYLVLSGGEDNAVSYTDTQYRAQIQANGTVGPWVQVTSLPSTRWFNRTAYYNHTLINYGGYNAAVIANEAQTAAVMPNGILGTYVISPNKMPDNNNYFSFADALAGGKLMSAMGRYGANVPIDEITYTKIMPDGSTSTWTKSGYVTFDKACDNDGDAYNGKFYAIGGRTVFAGGASAAAVKTVNIIPMEPDTADPDGATYVYAGSLDSAAIDLGTNNNLKTLTVTGSGLTPSNCEVRYRFAGPNAVFTDWLTLPGLSGTISGGARWFQYQLVLKGDGSTTPVVNAVTLTTKANAFVPTVEDVKKALAIAGGLQTASAADKTNLDVTGDGAITVLDALKLNRTINGK
jgi:hypothetical protein